MLVEIHNGKFVDAEVKELQRAVAACDNELVFVDFGPSQIV